MTDRVKVENDSAERVALDLALTIKHEEHLNERQGREYWLQLYGQCWRMAKGAKAENVIEED